MPTYTTQAVDVVEKHFRNVRTACWNDSDKQFQNIRPLVFLDKAMTLRRDQQTTLDLDDGVKANYRKLSDMLAESKAISGSIADE